MYIHVYVCIYIYTHMCVYIYIYTYVHMAGFKFGANVVIQVLCYRSQFLNRQIIWKECNQTWAQLETSPIRNEPNGK